MSTKNANLIIEEEDKGNFDRNLKNSIDTAKDEGYLEGEQVGLQKGKQIGLKGGLESTARNAKLMGLSIEDISKLTGLSTGEIENI